jgi:hypothetical protein
MRDQADKEKEEEAERNGTQKPLNECKHPAPSGVRTTMYKGPKPMTVTYCQDCGAIGPGAGIPTIGHWISPTFFRQ